MQTTNQDISAMLDCVSDMFGGVCASIDYEAALYTYNHTADIDKKFGWRLTIHAPSIIQKHFASWPELSAWVRSQDKDFSEQVIIGEVG